MSGNKNKDPKDYHPHIRTKKELKQLAEDFKNPDKDPQIAIVIDMWLTGFDAPCLHTMYFDKPMKGYSLVQAIARVNRVFKDKPGGLIVDYIGIADDLRKSLTMYTLSSIREVFLDIKSVIDQLKEKHDIITSLFHGVEFRNWNKLSPEDLSRLTTLAYDRICGDEDVKKRFVKNFVALKKLYALASPHPEAYKIRNDIIFFEMIKKMIVKYSTARIRAISRDLEHEISHLISRSITAREPVDVYSLIGKERPDISIFDENFLAQFRDMEYKNYAAQTLAKILKDQLTVRMKVNPFRYRSLYDLLTSLIDKYNIKLITTAEVIEKLINIARELKTAAQKGKDLKLTEEELAFYDLLSSERGLFVDYAKIRDVAKEIVKELGYYIKVADWNKKESIKAKIRTAVKNILLKIASEKASYDDIDRLSSIIIEHVALVYAA